MSRPAPPGRARRVRERGGAGLPPDRPARTERRRRPPKPPRSTFAAHGTPLVALGLGAAVALAVVASVVWGSADLGAGRVWAALVGGGTATDRTIVWSLRLPRVVLALSVGGGLAVVGVAMQALVRNPLAEPYILGASSGASAGAALFFLGFLPPVVSRAVSMPVAAVAGAWLAVAAVFAVARRGPTLSTTRLLLAGVAMSALLGSVTAFVTYASPEPDKLRTVLFWLLGSLTRARWSEVWAPLAVSLGAGGALWALARPLDLLTMGEEPAAALGVPVEALKRTLVAVAAVATGVLVASAGVIGFVGLIVPHAARLLIGATHRRLVPLAFAGGALFLLLADLAARTVLPGQEVPVGVLTAICGVPFFLALLRGFGRGLG
ncbi:iron ABC transporter permease [Rubrivirga sp. S365]|uniref:Iron ABC transporter permease n=1 Tax=Rubrivirga litoralis TaxID=3075598 RepID=A0ABU3BRH0_9BACT|nr:MULTISPECIES: iron ABC transporter permease [unclassified Rubrivirga]MDT0631886.1 iron ABC transporter permease [Rubrivirga sp. F394]MDT7857939.1 iron ABC transporter permease [Rubrivirga sp. S365]